MEQASCMKKIDYPFQLAIAASAIVAIGTHLSWTSTGIVYLLKTNVITGPQDTSWVSSLLPLGAILGSLPVGILADKYGRKFVACFSVLPLFISWLIICFVHTTPGAMGARFFAGIGCGASSVIIPMYYYELTNRYYQKRIVNLVQWCLSCGIICHYVVDLSFRFYNEKKLDPNSDLSTSPRYIALILLTGVMSFYSLLIILLPESPMWLQARGRIQEAEKAIKKLKGISVKLHRNEFMEVADNSGLRLSTFNAINNKKDIVLILSLITLQQFCGIGPIIFYLGMVMTLIVYQDMIIFVYHFILFVPMAIAFVSNVKLNQWIGEKCLLIITTCLMAICAFFLAGFSYFLRDEVNRGPHTYIIPSVLMTVYLTAFHVGLGPLPWTMIGKMFLSHSRKMVYNLAVTYSWLLLFITTVSFMGIVGLIQLYGVLLIYVFINLIGMAIAIFYIPKNIKDVQEDILENSDEMNEYT